MAQMQQAHDIETIIFKYTGKKFSPEAIKSGRMEDVVSAALALQAVEAQLLQADAELERLSAKIISNVIGAPGQACLQLFPGGEVKSSKIGEIDVLIAIRFERIKALRIATRYKLSAGGTA